MQRASLREPQLVEQLVEVPTVPFSFEHIIDNPVPGRGVSGHGGPQGLPPEQSSTAFGGADYRFPSPGRGSEWWRSLKVYNPGQDSTAFCGAEHGSLHGLRSGQDSTAFGEQNMELFKVYAQKRVPRRFSEVQVLVYGHNTLSQYRVQVFVMMLGSWSRRRSSARTTRRHDSLEIASWRASRVGVLFDSGYVYFDSFPGHLEEFPYFLRLGELVS